MEEYKAYIINEEIPHKVESAIPFMFKFLNEIYEKDKNIVIFTEYLRDEEIDKLLKGEYEQSHLFRFEPLGEFCRSNNILMLSLEPTQRWYHVSNEHRSVYMFKKFLLGYRKHLYGKEEKNPILFMGKPHGAYFEEMLKEMGYEVIIYEITLVDKGQLTPPFPYNYQEQKD